jgi:predicted phosphodiesterase
VRYALLSDIHANVTALEAVLTDLEKQGGADEIWCLGDIVGYGPDPHECLNLIRSCCSLCLAGNHDLAAINKINTEAFNLDAAKAARWNGDQLNQEEISFLSGLPLTIVRGDFTLAHGSPRMPLWEYIISANEAEENLDYFETRFCLVGHSHIAGYFACAPSCRSGRMGDGSSLNLKEGRYIINPGGVGQPRDRDPRAAYAIYNRESSEMLFRRVSYDIPSVQKRMREAGLPLQLSERLSYGR